MLALGPLVYRFYIRPYRRMYLFIYSSQISVLTSMFDIGKAIESYEGWYG